MRDLSMSDCNVSVSEALTIQITCCPDAVRSSRILRLLYTVEFYAAQIKEVRTKAKDDFRAEPQNVTDGGTEGNYRIIVGDK